MEEKVLLCIDENKKISNSIQRKIGIEILRFILCFRIVLLHYYSSDNRFINKLRKNFFQVPCFFFISFYFLYPIVIYKRNILKMRMRLERLLIPFIIYPFFFWSINNLLFLLFKINRFGRYLTIRELKTQLIVGRGIPNLSILWFQFNLIISTLFFFISSFLLKRYFLIFFQFIGSISYIFQYSGINSDFFNQYMVGTFPIIMPVGNLIEILPIAATAFSLSSINKRKNISCINLRYLFFTVFFFILISHYNIFTNIRGYSSPGFKPLVNSLLLFITFYRIPFETINHKILKIINLIIKYTPGIYCLHRLVMHYISLKFRKKGTFIGCIIVYIISYFLSYIGSLIFSKTKLKYLFN